jgi:hypothetical protein
MEGDVVGLFIWLNIILGIALFLLFFGKTEKKEKKRR